MIYPIKIKPAPRIAEGNHKGAEITAIGITDQGLDIYTPDTVIKGSYDLLPQSLRRTMGVVLKTAVGGRPGPFIITPEELAEDVTYDPDSGAGSLDKPEPEEVSYSHPKERKLRQKLGLEPPETDEILELPKYQKFPPHLPSKHPKERALEKQMAQGAAVNPLPQSLVDKVPSKTRIDKGSFPNPSRLIGTFEGKDYVILAFYPDEVSFSMGEVKGKTPAQLKALFHKKDLAYIKSGEVTAKKDDKLADEIVKKLGTAVGHVFKTDRLHDVAVVKPLPEGGVAVYFVSDMGLKLAAQSLKRAGYSVAVAKKDRALVVKPKE